MLKSNCVSVILCKAKSKIHESQIVFFLLNSRAYIHRQTRDEWFGYLVLRFCIPNPEEWNANRSFSLLATATPTLDYWMIWYAVCRGEEQRLRTLSVSGFRWYTTTKNSAPNFKVSKGIRNMKESFMSESGTLGYCTFIF